VQKGSQNLRVWAISRRPVGWSAEWSFWDVNLGAVMANICRARDPKRETVSASAVAEGLCVVVLEDGKAGGRYAMPFDDLAEVGRRRHWVSSSDGPRNPNIFPFGSKQFI
jgi:hypothetical protein